MVDLVSQREFVLGGHSNMYAMGAPRGYAGPLAVVPTGAFGRSGFFVMEEKPGPRTPLYWQMFAASVSDRDAIIVWKGNQHYLSLMFETEMPFDFFDQTFGYIGDLDGAALVPRRLIKEFFDPTIAPLSKVLHQLAEAGAASIAVVGTPPPWPDLTEFEDKLKTAAPFWGAVAQGCGAELSTAKLMSPRILLKLWSVIQEMLEEVAKTANSHFVAVPSAALDKNGYLAENCRLPTDFTHGNERFGNLMMRRTLGLGPDE